MLRKYPFYQRTVIGLLILLSTIFLSPIAYAATAVGHLDFAFGKPTATATDGTVRTLAKKSEIFEGDSIQTADGRIQIRFTDNSYIALQANTLFKVDEYKWGGKADGSEKASYNLTKGSLRTITGLIGHTNKKAYEIRTPTATIGIRGTAFSVNQSNDGLLVTVQRGLVSVSNQGGNITIGGGQSAFVRTPTSPPEMSNQSATAQPSNASGATQEEQQQQAISEQQQVPTDNVAATGDQRTSDGSAQILAQADPISGLGYSVAWTYGQSGIGPAVITDEVNSTFSGQQLTAFENDDGTLDFSSSQSHNVGWDGLIGWGRWTGSVAGNLPGSEQTYDNNAGLHYVFGKLAPDSAITARNGTTVRYDLVGNTSPSTFDGSTYSLGTLSGIGGDNANVSVNFAAGASTMTINARITNSSAGVNYNLASMFGAITIPLNGNPTASFVGNKSGGLGNEIYVSGIFAGNNAQRLGTAYEIHTEMGVQTSGAAAFSAR
tara:strand:+ start:387580 stop:389052 length:1473 start_codon:yes stop_codon:yes gene_type:complete